MRLPRQRHNRGYVQSKENKKANPNVSNRDDTSVDLKGLITRFQIPAI